MALSIIPFHFERVNRLLESKIDLRADLRLTFEISDFIN